MKKDEKKVIRNKIIIEVVKFIALVILLAFAIYYITWLNNASDFPELL